MVGGGASFSVSFLTQFSQASWSISPIAEPEAVHQTATHNALRKGPRRRAADDQPTL